MYKDNDYQASTHAKFKAEREKILKALWDQGDEEADKLAGKISDCCRYAEAVQYDESGMIGIHKHRCKSRVCPYCAAIRANQLRGKLTEMLGVMDAPAFITLTLQHSDTPLKDQLTHLVASARRLRQSKLWKAHVRGGVQVIEITYKEDTRAWHPHIHILGDTTYIPQRKLSQAWETASNGSSICHIKRLSSKAALANYLTTYASKGSDVAKMPENVIFEWAQNVHGKRFAQTFGSLHGHKTTADKPEDKETSVPLGGLASLYWYSVNGDDDAKDLRNRLIKLPQPAPGAVTQIITDAHQAWAADFLAWRNYGDDEDETPAFSTRRKPDSKTTSPGTGYLIDVKDNPKSALGIL